MIGRRWNIAARWCPLVGANTSPMVERVYDTNCSSSSRVAPACRDAHCVTQHSFVVVVVVVDINGVKKQWPVQHLTCHSTRNRRAGELSIAIGRFTRSRAWFANSTSDSNEDHWRTAAATSETFARKRARQKHQVSQSALGRNTKRNELAN